MVNTPWRGKPHLSPSASISVSNFAIGHGGEFVEQWKDKRWGEVGCDELKGCHEGPSPKPSIRHFVENPEDARHEGQAKERADETLDSIGEKQGFWSILFEAEFFFDYKSLVVVEGQGDEALREEKGGGKLGRSQFHFPKKICQTIEIGEAMHEPEGQQDC